MPSAVIVVRRPIFAWGALALLAGVLLAAVVLWRPLVPGPVEVTADLKSILLWYSLMPRAATALICGAALGLAGALLQRVLRNPIADPSTLGIASGAQLALVIATAYAPFLIETSREGVAIAGGVSAVAIVLALGWRRGLDPVTVVLSGMVISLVTAALSATVILAKGEYVMSIFIWGAGSLTQQSWDTAFSLAPRLVVGALAAALLLRPLAVLGLDDAGARSLGVALHTSRLLGVGVAVWLASAVTAEVGVIGFVGLAAAAFARVSGARTPRQTLIAAPLIGAVLLSLTDSAVQLLGSGAADLAPTGAATALFGGPLLIWLLPRLRAPTRAAVVRPPVQRVRHPRRGFIVLAALTVACAATALTVGQGPDGWRIAIGEFLPFRVPRMVAAGAAGAMLGAAGMLMQRMTGNPLAGPEVLGVSAGGGVGLAAALHFAPALGAGYLLAGIVGGSLAALLIMLGIASRSRAGPERLLLAGIALGAFCMAVISTVLSQGSTNSYLLLVWMSGSTNRVGAPEAWFGLLSALILIAPLFLAWRWLDILPLGTAAARSLGLSLRVSRLLLAGFAAILTAIASFLVGPLSMIGLIAPHIARTAGFVRGRDHLLASVILGCAIMIAADWSSRMIAFPYQIPVGLFSALIGGPYLIWLLGRENERHG